MCYFKVYIDVDIYTVDCNFGCYFDIYPMKYVCIQLYMHFTNIYGHTGKQIVTTKSL